MEVQNWWQIHEQYDFLWALFFERKGWTWPALISQPYCEFVVVNTFTCPMFCWDLLELQTPTGVINPKWNILCYL